MKVDIKWLGHASFKFKGSKVIYSDPWKITPDEKADIVLVSHSHHDHMSPSDVKGLLKEETVVVTSLDCVDELPGTVTGLEPGQSTEIGDVRIDSVPAYNQKKKFHPKSSLWLGFIINMDGVRIYQAGDTDMIPEMAGLRDIDYALLPVGGTYTMDAAEAAKALKMIKPRIAAIPYHYGDIVGTEADAKEFKKRSGFPVTIMK